MGEIKSKFLIQRRVSGFSHNHQFENKFNLYWEVLGDNPNACISLLNGEVLLYGDCLNPYVFQDFDNIGDAVKMAKGHFIVIFVQKDIIHVAASYFAFLPIYVTQSKQVVSNDWNWIVGHSHKEISEQFIVESHLFNYPIGNGTLYSDVFLADSFALITLDKEGFSSADFVNIEDWFVTEVDFSIDLKVLADKFIEKCQAYFTSDQELITFTSGFDGRTILANALAIGRPVHAFSMGRLHNDDVVNPKSNANDLGISFEAIDLAGKDYTNLFLETAKELSRISGGRNGFLYPHFLYCSKRYENFDTMQTGYCGSELFRALHIAGAVTSAEMVAIFLKEDEDDLIQFLFGSSRLKFLDPKMIERVKPHLIESIKSMRKKRVLFKNTNHFFYYFIFKEVFRKVFGFWTNAQFHHIKVRTPFLDFEFIQLLLRSEYAGCNNEFFTHNPLKRYKGQLLYAQILKNLKSPLFGMMTGKHYRPRQLLTFWGQMSIVLPYLRKRIKKKSAPLNIDNLYLISGFQSSWPEIQPSLLKIKQFYKIEEVTSAIKRMHPTMSEVERDMLFQIASLSLTLFDDEVSSTH
jgi:hypothetical protein